jgi:hypothetical protein
MDASNDNLSCALQDKICIIASLFFHFSNPSLQRLVKDFLPAACNDAHAVLAAPAALCATAGYVCAAAQQQSADPLQRSSCSQLSISTEVG